MDGMTQEQADGMFDLIGSKVIVKSDLGGVIYGTLERIDKEFVVLRDARRIWKWGRPKLEDVCAYGVGLSAELSKPIAIAVVKTWYQIMSTSDSCASTIE